MSGANLPRVLVVAANPFAHGRNNSVTMMNLFGGWPAEDLAQIYIQSATRIEPALDFCRDYWRVTSSDALRARIGLSRSCSVKQRQQSVLVPRPANGVGTSRWQREALLVAKNRLRRLAEPAREFIMRPNCIITRELTEWLSVFKPEVLYTMVGSLHVADLVLELSRRLGVPFVSHITDDWIPVLYSRCLFSKTLRRRTEETFRRLFAEAAACLAICGAMAAEYKSRYNREFLPFMNCADVTKFTPWEPAVIERKEVRFTYMGGLNNGRGDILIRLAQCLDKLRDNGLDCQLGIYTQPEWVRRYGEALTRHRTVRFPGWVPAEEIPRVLMAADVLLCVESFEPEMASLIRLSMSTKIPEYLCAGRCIFGVGPGTVASLRYLQAAGAAHVVTTAEEGVLSAALREIATKPEYRSALGARARQVAVESFDAVAQRARFRQVLVSAAEGRAVP